MEDKNNNLAVAFAFIPGAGQMYLGFMKRGLSLTIVFAFCVLLTWLLTPMGVLLPIVWMYSFFDTLSLRGRLSIHARMPRDRYLFGLEGDGLDRLIEKRHRTVGVLLVMLGVYALYDHFLQEALGGMAMLIEESPLFRALAKLLQEMPILVLCFFLIILGIRLIRKPLHIHLLPDDDEEYEEEEYPAAPSAPPAPPRPAAPAGRVVYAKEVFDAANAPVPEPVAAAFVSAAEAARPAPPAPGPEETPAPEPTVCRRPARTDNELDELIRQLRRENK